MHKGRTYPYHPSRWLVEVFFWPGFVPRCLHVQTTTFNGDSWDLLAGGVLMDTSVGDLPVVGDLRFSYLDPGGLFILTVNFHKVGVLPKRYSIAARLAVPGPHANIASLEVGPELHAFGPFFPTHDSGADPPFFNGNVPILQIRAATWSEI